MVRVWLVLRMGARNVFRYRRRSVISGFAIAFAVMLTNCVRGLTNGSETMVFEQIVLGQVGAVQVHKTGFVANVLKAPITFAFPVDDALMKTIRETPGVTDAAARIHLAGMISNGEKSVPSQIIAIDPVHEYAVCPIKKIDVANGKPLGVGGAVMTPQLKRQLGAELGAEITMLSQDSEGVMNGALAKADGFLSDIPLLTNNKKLMFVSLEVAQALLRIEGKALEIAVGAADYRHPEALAAALQQKLGPEYEVHTWSERAPMMVDSLAERRVILNYVTAGFIMIALFGVLMSMLLSVLGRTREIGTMMAVGIRRKQIIQIFLAEAAVLGVIASLVGTAIGQIIVNVVRVIGFPITIPGGATTMMLRPSVEWSFALMIAGVVACGCIIASIYPAYRAARLKPIEAMGAL